MRATKIEFQCIWTSGKISINPDYLAKKKLEQKNIYDFFRAFVTHRFQVCSKTVVLYGGINRLLCHVFVITNFFPFQKVHKICWRYMETPPRHCNTKLYAIMGN